MMAQLTDSRNDIHKSKICRSPSPFNDLQTPLKSGSNNVCVNENGYLVRTRSLDDEQQQQKETHNCQQIRKKQQQYRKLQFEDEDDINMFCEEGSSCCESEDPTVVGTAALHSSFDASLLRSGTSCSGSGITLFETNLNEDDDGTMGVNICLDQRRLSFPKHQLRCPRRAVSGSGCYQNLKPPGTVRKKNSRIAARRRSSDTATTVATNGTISSPFSLSNTPVRPQRHIDGYDHKSPAAPSSNAKRRLATPFIPARQSPMRRVAAPSSSATTTPSLFPPPVLFGSSCIGNIAIGSSSNKNNNMGVSNLYHINPPTLTPTHQNLLNGPHGTVKKISYYTGTTTGTTAPLETTFESDADSIDTTNSPTRFRFTSFPASLPRVQNPRTTPPVCPGSVRKRMSFESEDDTGAVTTTTGVNKCSTEDGTELFDTLNSQDANQSRDDEGTQNTSLSSLSIEGGHHQHLPHLPNQHPPHFASVPMEKLLTFSGKEGNNHNHEPINNNLFGYSDDENDDGDARSANHEISAHESHDQIVGVGRTRLDFNVFLSPGNKKNSKNYNSKENDGVGKGINLNGNIDLSRPYEHTRINSFQSSLSSHTRMNASNNEDAIGVSVSPPRTTKKNHPPETPREVQVHFHLLSECSPILGAREDAVATAAIHRYEDSSESSSLLVGDRLMLKSSISNSSLDFRFSTKHETQKKVGSSISSESTSSTQKRRLRPMPDMSAFENVKNGTRGDRSIGDSANTGDSRGKSLMNHRACPPTPQRTPAWANEGGPHVFIPNRQNSLITTKVLLSCPSQVLEGRSSLEDSVLEEDSKSSGTRRHLKSRNKPSLLPEQPRNNKNDNTVEMDVDKCNQTSPSTTSVPSVSINAEHCEASRVQIAAPPKLMRRLPSKQDANTVISFSNDFEILSTLGSGTFADAYKVRLKSDDHLYAVKRNRRQFRGKRDRDMALAEVQSMQRLQSVFTKTTNCSEEKPHHSNLEKNCYSLYLLFFYRAWQEDGYFYSQTELCCRDTCREMMDSLRFMWNSSKTKYPSLVKKFPQPPGVEAGSRQDAFGRLVPNMTVWKICHDILAGLSHIHSHGIVHQDIKPSNIFLVANARFGAMCKIGDFGMAGSIGQEGDGQEGDTRYMPAELLTSATRHTSSDIFSLGLTLYEIAVDENIDMPSEGPHWHQLRSCNEPKLPTCRGDNLRLLLQSMTNPDETKRPNADTILQNENVKGAGHGVDTFLQDYIKDVEEHDRQEERLAFNRSDDQTPQNSQRSTCVRSPSLNMLLPSPPNLFSPPAKYVHS